MFLLLLGAPHIFIHSGYCAESEFSVLLFGQQRTIKGLLGGINWENKIAFEPDKNSKHDFIPKDKTDLKVKNQSLKFLTSSRTGRRGRARKRPPAASASQGWSRPAEGGGGCPGWRTSGTICPPSVCTLLPRSPWLTKSQERITT